MQIQMMVTVSRPGASHFIPQEFSQLASSTRRPHRLPLSHRPHRRLAGLLFGFDTAVINGALLSLRSHFALSEIQVEFAASSLLYGCFFGAMAAGSLSDRYGRRSILRLSAALFLLSAVFAAVPTTFAEFLMARFLGGLGIGFASTIAPLYLAEVSPNAKARQHRHTESDCDCHGNAAGLLH
jgi:MFS family permease